MKPASNALALATPGRRGRAELEFLPAALEVLETPASPTGRITAASIAAFFTAALAWSVLGHVDIVATAPGTVIPSGKVKTVQSLDPGVVKAILVQDGDHVRAGQALLTLDVTEAAAERDRLARDLRQARLNMAGRQALATDLETGSGLDGFAPPSGVPVAEIATEQAAIGARRQEQLAKLASLEQQIAGKQADAAENEALVAKLQASLPFLQQKRDLYRSLLNVQFSNRVAWLESEQAFADAQHQLAVQRQHASGIEAAREALVHDLAQARASYAAGLMKDLAESETRAGELEQQYAAAAHKAARTVLAAPIGGTVQDLAVHTLGGVVTSAEHLMTVVPDQGPVLVEAAIENKDIGFVHSGQDAEIKVETFAFTRYGLLHGRVLDVSRNAMADEERGPVRAAGSDGQQDKASPDADRAAYVAHVALDRSSLVVDGKEEPLRPGMRVTAEIKTGRRRVISYLLSPLQRYAHDFGGER